MVNILELIQLLQHDFRLEISFQAAKTSRYIGGIPKYRNIHIAGILSYNRFEYFT